MAPMLRSPDEPFPASSNPGGAAVALLTHLHADHADADALDVALRDGARVFRPEPATGTGDDRELTAIGEEKFTHHDLATEFVGLWAERTVGPFRMYSAPAVDGFGDTLFHGYWWRIAHRFGSFDMAFFPINAPVCQWPHLQPSSPIEVTMMPEEAAVAANIIHAKTVVPIHYGSLNKEPIYVETPNATQSVRDKADEYGIRVDFHEPGEWFEPD